MHTSYSGQEGLTYVEQFRPHVVLFDLAMPTMDRYETCRWIRVLHEGRELVLVALSSYNQPDEINRSFAAGFSAHMVTPVNLTLLRRQS